MEQEALLSIWLKGEGNAPLNLQLQTAQNRILSVRKLGKSVDRKLNANYKRAKTYSILSLEEKEGQLPSFLDLLPSPFLVEEYVFAKLTFLEILSYLEPEERRCALLRCLGFTVHKVAAETHSSSEIVKQHLESARRKLWWHVSGNGEV